MAGANERSIRVGLMWGLRRSYGVYADLMWGTTDNAELLTTSDPESQNESYERLDTWLLVFCGIFDYPLKAMA
jgi:hypothetical protein